MVRVVWDVVSFDRMVMVSVREWWSMDGRVRSEDWLRGQTRIVSFVSFVASSLWGWRCSWCLGVGRCFSFVWVILAQWLVLMVVLSSYVYGVVSSALCWWYIVYGVQRCVGDTSWTISSTLC